MEELNKSIVDVPLSCGGSELPLHVLCLAKHRTGNSAGQIGCLSPANSYWQKETNSHFYSHPQAILSFFHLTCVSLDCGRKTTGAPENTFRQTENTQTPKRRQIVTRIFMKCVILSRFITLFLHQNNFLELIWLVDCFFFSFSRSLKKICDGIFVKVASGSNEFVHSYLRELFQHNAVAPACQGCTMKNKA